MENGQGGALTSQQIIDLLNSDFEFGINFIIDNNPQAIESNISSLSIPLPQNPSNLQMREVIDTLLQDGTNDQAVQQITEILDVQYIDTAPNYTGGFANYLHSQKDPSATGMVESGGIVVANVIGNILNAVGSVWSAYKQEDILELQQEMMLQQQQFELEKIEKTKVLGIPQAVFIAIIVFVMFVALIIFLTNRK
tara:strand:- start:412 stop:996 length:585 start_codon:yes stop_codon:yes gene_type:complete